jgi:hypothetical protein
MSTHSAVTSPVDNAARPCQPDPRQPVRDKLEATKEAMKQLGIRYPQLLDPETDISKIITIFAAYFKTERKL